MPTLTPTRDIWTRLAIDPLAEPLSRALAPRRVVTPNRVTAVAGVLGLAAAACLATGNLRLGGALFLLRFLTDCVDGKVARAQATSSHQGAFLDVATDVCGVTASYAALAWWAVDTGRVTPAVALAMLAALGTYGWSLAHRKDLAHREDGDGDEGRAHFPRSTGIPPVDGWLGLCRRAGMRPLPWTVEVETLVLGLLPLAGAAAAAVGVPVALAFYVVATTANLLRCWRIAGRLDVRSRS